MSPKTAEDKLSTIFFPLTANPAGYHHLSLAECVLRQFTETRLIVFLLSNGQHPDPFTKQQIPEAALRLEILRGTLAEWSDPEKAGKGQPVMWVRGQTFPGKVQEIKRDVLPVHN